MNKENMIKYESAAYVSPQIEIISLETEGVFCDSILDGVGNEDPMLGGDI